MSDYKRARDQIELAHDIVGGKMHMKQVQKRLKAMKDAHKEPFSTYIPMKKDKPWDVEYLKSLGESVTFGGGSEEQFLYMAEVADEVYMSRRLLKHCIIVIVSVATLIAIVAAVSSLLGRRN